MMLACISRGIIFEYIFYGLGVNKLEDSIRKLKPKAIITVSCTIETEGFESHYQNVNQAWINLNEDKIRCILL